MKLDFTWMKNFFSGRLTSRMSKRMARGLEFPLEGLFLHLSRSRQILLSMRDYNDSIRALELGYGLGYGINGRENLQWLCRTLWARTDEEVRSIDLLFRSLPKPSEQEVHALTGRTATVEKKDKTAAAAGLQDKKEEPQQKQDQDIPALEFVGSKNAGLALPRAHISAPEDEPFILTKRQPVTLRSMIIAWRRFSLPSRLGPKTDLDINATVHEQCRLGCLVEPVLLPTRCNQARLVVLVDTSSSMVAWQGFNEILLESLRDGGLKHYSVYFFHNTPDDTLYQTEGLTQPLALSAALKQDPATPVLIISDAGAARGMSVKARIKDTKQFLRGIGASWRPIGWLNPMPCSRWKESSASTIAEISIVSMHELNESGVTRVIDVLRGYRRD